MTGLRVYVHDDTQTISDRQHNIRRPADGGNGTNTEAINDVQASRMESAWKPVDVRMVDSTLLLDDFLGDKCYQHHQRDFTECSSQRLTVMVRCRPGQVQMIEKVG